MKAKDRWLADAKASAREIWRENNRALARKRTEALEAAQRITSVPRSAGAAAEGKN